MTLETEIVVAIVLAILAISFFMLYDYLSKKGYDLIKVLRSAWIFLISTFLATFLSFLSVMDVRDRVALYHDGVLSSGIVIDSEIKKEIHRGRLHAFNANIIRYDGNERTFYLDKIYPPGTTFSIYYSSSNHDNAIIGDPPRNLINVIFEGKPMFMIFLFIIFPLILWGVSLYLVIQFFNKETYKI